MQHGAPQPNPTQCNAAPRHNAMQPDAGPHNRTQPATPQHNAFPPRSLPQSAHPLRTPPRGADSPVAPSPDREGLSRCGVRMGSLVHLGHPSSVGALTGALGGRGMELCQGLKPAWDCAGRTLPFRQRVWQRGQPWDRAATELLALGPVLVPPVGHAGRDGNTGSDDGKKQPPPLLAPPNSPPPPNHLLCLF